VVHPPAAGLHAAAKPVVVELAGSKAATMESAWAADSRHLRDQASGDAPAPRPTPGQSRLASSWPASAASTPCASSIPSNALPLPRGG
jgi:hypothetical protein